MTAAGKSRVCLVCLCRESPCKIRTASSLSVFLLGLNCNLTVSEERWWISYNMVEPMWRDYGNVTRDPVARSRTSDCSEAPWDFLDVCPQGWTQIVVNIVKYSYITLNSSSIVFNPNEAHTKTSSGGRAASQVSLTMQIMAMIRAAHWCLSLSDNPVTKRWYHHHW